MSHAKALRVIGQRLEAAHVPTFELEKYGSHYIVWTASLSASGEAIIRKALSHDDELSATNSSGKSVFCFSPGDVSRLDAQAQKQRRHQSASGMRTAKLISHGLRTLGDFFDRVQVHAFRVEWNIGSIRIDYQRMDGKRNCKTFAPAELRYLCERSKMQRRDAEETLLSF